MARPPAPTALPNRSDVAPADLEPALADLAWTAETWPSGPRAWLHAGGGAAWLETGAESVAASDQRLARARALLAEAAAEGAFEMIGEAVMDVAIVACGDVRLDPLDIILLDGAPLAHLPYAIRALALADALERLREASPSGSSPLIRLARTPALGAAKRAVVGRPDPLRIVLRDLRAPYGVPGAILRVPSVVAGLFDDPWRELLDPA